MLAACSGAVLAPEVSVPVAYRDLLPAGTLRVRELGLEGGDLALAGSRRVLVATDGWRVPNLTLGEAVSQNLRQWVDAGGRLVLVGFPAAVVTELGIETEHPESETFRWGFDARTSVGRARLGLQVTSGLHPELFDGLQSTAGADYTHYVAGGAPCCVPLCAWTIGEPRQGAVLARLATEFDGIPGPPGPPVLVRWNVGEGEVLALGVQPELDHPDEQTRSNARRLLRNLLGVAADGGGEAVMLHLPAAPLPALPELAPDFAAREVPMQPLLAHWGWSVAVAQASDRERLRRVDEIVDSVLTPSWTAGADLLELEACHPERGLSLVWPEGDAMRRPPGFRGAAFDGAFDVAAFGRIAAEAHGRGMLVHALLAPLPFGDGARERLASLRFVARQLADVRRLGRRAIDGFGWRQWLLDDRGYSRAMVQDFHPAAYLFGLGEQAPTLAGGLRASDADDGALRGLMTVGLCDGWRDGFPPDLYPLGVLDARSHRALPSLAGQAHGGGSFGDWIVTQCNDFVRARKANGGALWWRTHDPELLGRHGVDYVHGISLDPLRAAVAMQLAATGSNGYRAAAAALVQQAPPEFPAALPARAVVHVLQNNWFRLIGSGGGLLFDPTGEARFRPGEAQVLTPSFLQTRLFGGRPEASAVKSVDLDLLLAGAGTAGGYGRTAVVGKAGGVSQVVPAMLAFDDQPKWPQRVQIELAVATGYYELEIAPRAVQGRGILVLGLDGTVLDCRPFRAGDRAEVVTVPVHMAREGVRVLELEVAEGGTVAIDHLRLVRRNDVAAEGRVQHAAGHYAQLGERSASSYHADEVELCTIGDFPGFLMRLRCVKAARNLRFERSISLPGYDELAVSAAGEEGQLRAPFVLRAAASALPDLVVVPTRLTRYDHFTFAPGQLVLQSNHETGTESHIGFWLLPHGRGDDALPSAAAVFRGLAQPLLLDLGDHGKATLVAEQAHAWNRIVRVQSNTNTPYQVKENGWWTWRGAQPDGQGADWLRVCQLPGDIVEIANGPAVLARTRPGPGSLHVLALRDPEPASVRVRVLQPSRLVPPSVVMAVDFDAVRVNGEPWGWFDGRRVFLPDRPGDYDIETVVHGGVVSPHVKTTRAPVLRCSYDSDTRTLLLQCGRDPQLPAGQPYTAVLAGPLPSRVDNGEVVAEEELPHADAGTSARAAAGGVLIRFRPGLTKVHYEN